MIEQAPETQGQRELIGRLETWAVEANVSPTWNFEMLLLQSQDGTSRAVVSFPVGFWEAFPLASDERRTDALDVIATDVQALYEADWAMPGAKVIEVHSALLRET